MLTATQKGVNTKIANKIDIALCVKEPSLHTDTSVISYLRVLRERNNICKHFKRGFTPFVFAVRVLKLILIYVQNAKAKTIVISLQMLMF